MSAEEAFARAAEICRGVYGNGSNLEHAISERCAMLIEEEASKLNKNSQLRKVMDDRLKPSPH